MNLLQSYCLDTHSIPNVCPAVAIRCWRMQFAVLWQGLQHSHIQPCVTPVQLQIPLVLWSQVSDLHHQNGGVYLQINNPVDDVFDSFFTFDTALFNFVCRKESRFILGTDSNTVDRLTETIMTRWCWCFNVIDTLTYTVAIYQSYPFKVIRMLIFYSVDNQVW